MSDSDSDFNPRTPQRGFSSAKGRKRRYKQDHHDVFLHKRPKHSRQRMSPQSDEASVKKEENEIATIKDITAREPNITWSGQHGSYMRAMVVFTYRAYAIGWSDLSTIFWDMFYFQLTQDGLRNNMSLTGRLIAQYHEIVRRPRESHKIFTVVPFEELRSTCLELDAHITRTAEALGIDLQPRTIDSLGPRPVQPDWKKIYESRFPRKPEPLLIDLCPENVTPSSFKISNIIRKPQSVYLKNESQGPLISLAHGDCIPEMLFRAWDSNNHGLNSQTSFKAARFNAAGSIISLPPDPAQILDDVENHLYSAKFDGPFISTTSSFIWALQKAMKRYVASQGKQETYLSCMSGLSIASYTPAFHTEQFVQNLRSEGRARRPYRGSREWLVWAQIHSSCILLTIPLSAILDLAKDPNIAAFLQLDLFGQYSSMHSIRNAIKMFDANTATGQIIGKIVSFFLDQSASHNYTHSNPVVNALVWIICQNWKVNIVPAEWISNHEFVKGVDHSLANAEKLRFGTSQITVMPITPHRVSTRDTGLITPLTMPSESSAVRQARSLSYNGTLSTISPLRSRQSKMCFAQVAVDIESEAETELLDESDEASDYSIALQQRLFGSESPLRDNNSTASSDDASCLLSDTDEEPCGAEDGEVEITNNKHNNGHASITPENAQSSDLDYSREHPSPLSQLVFEVETSPVLESSTAEVLDVTIDEALQSDASESATKSLSQTPGSIDEPEFMFQAPIAPMFNIKDEPEPSHPCKHEALEEIWDEWDAEKPVPTIEAATPNKLRDILRYDSSDDETDNEYEDRDNGSTNSSPFVVSLTPYPTTLSPLSSVSVSDSETSPSDDHGVENDPAPSDQKYGHLDDNDTATIDQLLAEYRAEFNRDYVDTSEDEDDGDEDPAQAFWPCSFKSSDSRSGLTMFSAFPGTP